MLFVISIVPFLSAVAIACLYASGFWMVIISGGRLFQALMLLGRSETLYASVLARRLAYDSVCRVRTPRAGLTMNSLCGLTAAMISLSPRSEIIDLFMLVL